MRERERAAESVRFFFLVLHVVCVLLYTRVVSPQSRQVSLAVLSDPGLDGYELGYVARYAALEYSTVAPYHVLGHYFRMVRLRYNFKQTADIYIYKH